MDVVVAPRALVEAGGRYRLNAQYYITKQINPAIARVLQLVGADVPAWWGCTAVFLPTLWYLQIRSGFAI
jgi:DNA polymerase elongation subunit (family B)